MDVVDINDRFLSYYDARFRWQGRCPPNLDRKARRITLIDANILYNELHPNEPKKSLLV